MGSYCVHTLDTEVCSCANKPDNIYPDPYNYNAKYAMYMRYYECKNGDIVGKWAH